MNYNPRHHREVDTTITPRAALKAQILRYAVLGSWVTVIAAIGYCGMQEARTSTLQSALFSRYAAHMGYRLEKGPAPEMIFPDAGPYDKRLGYADMPRFIHSLENQGYAIDWQSRATPAFNEFVKLGGFPIYHEKTSAGLTLYDRSGALLYTGHYPTRVFASYDDIPPLVVSTLTFIENRELFSNADPQHNPAVEWSRFFYACIGQIISAINPGINLGGGSTLATQIEKFRHSPAGETHGAKDKFRQMISASMRAYMDGKDTTAARRRIVLDYLNSTPLTGRLGIGEVNGVGDGLWAWFGTDFNNAMRWIELTPQTKEELTSKAIAYKQVLALMLAERRPSYYLLVNRKALNDLANEQLGLLYKHGVIDEGLYKQCLETRLAFSEHAPEPDPTSYLDEKAANAIRTRLLSLLDINSVYALDRYDLSVSTTLDFDTQKRVVSVLKQLNNNQYAEQMGLTGFRLLSPDNDMSKLIYSFVLFERGTYGNYVRLQADNLDQPLDLNDGAKLDLGSTAKLRTLALYLEIIAELHKRYYAMDQAGLAAVAERASDPLTRWVVQTLNQPKKPTLKEILDLSMQRNYSGLTSEVFFTGGGIHTFVNFEHSEDKIQPLEEGFRNSVNLVFVRVMRDIRDYFIAQGPQSKSELLDDPDNPERQTYLSRFADTEGSVFLNRFYQAYKPLDPAVALDTLSKHARKNATAQTVIFRSVKPAASFAEYAAYMRGRPFPLPDLSDQHLQKLYDTYALNKFDLSDRGFIAGIHPLELWLVAWMQTHPHANHTDMLQASKEERQDTYDWLFHTRHKSAQDTRIRILLEEDAFEQIHKRWARLGYPFDHLVPSLATAIGSSADRPGALAELMGIIVNKGVKLPTVRVENLDFATDTPYQTMMSLKPDKMAEAGEQVMLPEIAAVLRPALIDVATNGTAKRIAGAFTDKNGQKLEIGGKTGTGDDSYDEFAKGRHVIGRKVVARTATFVFFIGDRFFGTITAHVEGADAANYKFTSALSAQLLKSLAPAIQPLIDRSANNAADSVVDLNIPSSLTQASLVRTGSPGQALPGASAAPPVGLPPPAPETPPPTSIAATPVDVRDASRPQ